MNRAGWYKKTALWEHFLNRVGLDQFPRMATYKEEGLSCSPIYKEKVVRPSCPPVYEEKDRPLSCPPVYKEKDGRLSCPKVSYSYGFRTPSGVEVEDHEDSLEIQLRCPRISSFGWCLRLYSLVLGGLGLLLSFIWVCFQLYVLSQTTNPELRMQRYGRLGDNH